MHARRVRVWDLPTRVFHWSLAVLVVVSVITAKLGGNLMQWHEISGLTIIALLVFRLFWGFFGSTYARFVVFLCGPHCIAEYFRGRWQGVGHNPLGALSVIAMMALLLLLALTGLFANDDIAFNGPLYALLSKAESNAITAWHHRGEYLLYTLVGLHVAAVFYYTWWRKENLVWPMFTGDRFVTQAGAKSAVGGGLLALLFGLALAAAAVWVAAGGLLPPPPPPPLTPAW